MIDLRVGESVLVAGGVFSEVFLFTHADPNVSYRFIRLHTASGRDVMMTESHYIYRNGTLSQARDVKIGDKLTIASQSSPTDLEESFITKITVQITEGLYNPQTIQGTIFVDGVLTSCYTRAINPIVAHALLIPLRIMHHIRAYMIKYRAHYF